MKKVSNGRDTMWAWQFYSLNVHAVTREQREVLPLEAQGKVRAHMYGGEGYSTTLQFQELVSKLPFLDFQMVLSAAQKGYCIRQ